MVMVDGVPATVHSVPRGMKVGEEYAIVPKLSGMKEILSFLNKDKQSSDRRIKVNYVDVPFRDSGLALRHCGIRGHPAPIPAPVHSTNDWVEVRQHLCEWGLHSDFADRLRGQLENYGPVARGRRARSGYPSAEGRYARACTHAQRMCGVAWRGGEVHACGVARTGAPATDSAPDPSVGHSSQRIRGGRWWHRCRNRVQAVRDWDR